jgi:hypothetical protein
MTTMEELVTTLDLPRSFCNVALLTASRHREPLFLKLCSNCGHRNKFNVDEQALFVSSFTKRSVYFVKIASREAFGKHGKIATIEGSGTTARQARGPVPGGLVNLHPRLVAPSPTCTGTAMQVYGFRDRGAPSLTQR